MAEEIEKNNVECVAEELRSKDANAVLEVLSRESVHAVAVVVSLLGSDKAAFVLGNLPEELRLPVAIELLKGEKVLLDLVDIIAKDILEKVSVVEKRRCVTVGGIDFVVGVLNRMELHKERELISSLEEADAALCEAVKSRLFVFEDIVLLDDRSIQKVLREVDQVDLAKALKNVDDEVKDKFFKNMSKRATDMLKEEMEFMGPMRVSDILEQQNKIVDLIRRLEESGEIVIARYD